MNNKMTKYTAAGGSPVLDPAHSENQSEELNLLGAVDMPTVGSSMTWKLDGGSLSPSVGESDRHPEKEVIHIRTEVHSDGDCPCS